MKSNKQVTAPAVRHAMIAESAFFLAEKRGFAVGLDLEDWFAAEALVDDLLGKESSQGTPSAGGKSGA